MRLRDLFSRYSHFFRGRCSGFRTQGCLCNNDGFRSSDALFNDRHISEMQGVLRLFRCRFGCHGNSAFVACACFSFRSITGATIATAATVRRTSVAARSAGRFATLIGLCFFVGCRCRRGYIAVDLHIHGNVFCSDVGINSNVVDEAWSVLSRGFCRDFEIVEHCFAFLICCGQGVGIIRTGATTTLVAVAGAAIATATLRATGFRITSCSAICCNNCFFIGRQLFAAGFALLVTATVTTRFIASLLITIAWLCTSTFATSTTIAALATLPRFSGRLYAVLRD